MHLFYHLLAVLAGLTLVSTVAIETNTFFYEYIGCYTDSSTSRTLTGISNTNLANNDPQSCAAFCGGTSYMGVEYS